MAEKDSIDLTARQLGLVIAAVAALVGGGNYAWNQLAPPPSTLTCEELRRDIERDLALLRTEIVELKHWRHTHEERATKITNEWNKWAGKIDAEHQYFMNRMQ